MPLDQRAFHTRDCDGANVLRPRLIMVIRALIKILHPWVIAKECFASGAYSEDAEPSNQATLLQNPKRDLELPVWLFHGQTELVFPAAEPLGRNLEGSWAEPVD